MTGRVLGGMLASNSHELRVAAVRRHVTIFDVFERMGIDVPHETQQMRCPFHADRSPSARVYADQNKLYCFTCQKSWDVIDAAQDHLGVPFDDALVWLEQEFGVPGGTATLTSTIRSQLTMRQPADLRLAVDHVEQTIRSRRAALGYERYTRCLTALDLTVYDAAERKIPATEATSRMQKILAAATV